MADEKTPKKPEPRHVIFDAEGAVIGRLCAVCAKLSLQGHKIDIVNIEKAVMTGRREYIIEMYRKRRHMTQKANPEEAAKWPRRPDYFFKNMLKGMLPKRTSRSKVAAGRTMAHIGVPAEFAGKAEKFATAKFGGKGGKFVKKVVRGLTVAQICHELGWVSKK